MSFDQHLHTGEYDPETYWDGRAVHGGDEPFRAVCGFSRDVLENAAMHRVQSSLLTSLLADIPLEGRHVVELGCGVGRWVEWWRDRGARYTGLDVSEEMIRLARDRHPGVEFVKVHASAALPLPDASCDLACSVTVLHHNPREQQNRLLGELLRLVRPGGHLLLLEGLEPKHGRVSFNMFPRPLSGWLAAVPPELAKRVRFRVARWWLTREAIDGAVRFLRPERWRPRIAAQARHDGEGKRRSARSLSRAGRLLITLGARLDPYIMRFLPHETATHVVVLFRRY